MNDFLKFSRKLGARRKIEHLVRKYYFINGWTRTRFNYRGEMQYVDLHTDPSLIAFVITQYAKKNDVLDIDELSKKTMLIIDSGVFPDLLPGVFTVNNKRFTLDISKDLIQYLIKETSNA